MAASGETVRSVTRSFNILETIASKQVPLGVSEIAKLTSLPLPTTHRLLKTLAESGHVCRLPNSLYILGPSLLRLSSYAGGFLGFSMRPFLEDAALIIRENIAVAIFEQDYARYIAHVPAEGSQQLFSQIGNLASLHASGVGKVLLSTLSEQEVREIVKHAGMRRFTANTITDPDVLLKDLEKIRQRGFAIDNQEHTIGVYCVAVPISYEIPLAVSASAPPERFPKSQLEQVVLPALMKVASDISQKLSEVFTS